MSVCDNYLYVDFATVTPAYSMGPVGDGTTVALNGASYLLQDIYPYGGWYSCAAVISSLTDPYCILLIEDSFPTEHDFYTAIADGGTDGTTWTFSALTKVTIPAELAGEFSGFMFDVGYMSRDKQAFVVIDNQTGTSFVSGAITSLHGFVTSNRVVSSELDDYTDYVAYKFCGDSADLVGYCQKFFSSHVNCSEGCSG